MTDSRDDIFIIPPETRKKLKESTFAMAGAGVGGATAYLWALIGGRNLRLADPGDLGPHKLARFIGGDIGESGENQAVLYSRLIYEARPYANILCIPKGLGNITDEKTHSMRDFYTGATIAGEAMDDLMRKGQARALLQELGIPYVTPSDLNREGFVGFNDNVLARLSPDVVTKMMDPKIDQGTKTDLAINVFIGPKAPDDMVLPLHQARAAQLPFWPQNGIAAFASAAGAVYTMLEYLEGTENIPAERPIRLGWNAK